MSDRSTVVLPSCPIGRFYEVNYGVVVVVVAAVVAVVVVAVVPMWWLYWVWNTRNIGVRIPHDRSQPRLVPILG